MGVSRESLRREAKKIYKEQVKGVPKKQRISFSQFFKRFKDSKSDKVDDIDVHKEVEDFDFEDMINVDKNILEEKE